MATKLEEAHSDYASSIEHNLPNLRARHVPDVPEDVDFLMEHLNDPNFDLTQSRPPSFSSIAKNKNDLYNSDIDAESQLDSDRYSSSRPESRNSTAVDFDE